MRSSDSLADPAQRAFAITTADSDFADNVQARALYIGGAGNVSVIAVGDTVAVTFVGVQAGTILPISVKQVRQTGTTATSIVGLY